MGDREQVYLKKSFLSEVGERMFKQALVREGKWLGDGQENLVFLKEAEAPENRASHHPAVG